MAESVEKWKFPVSLQIGVATAIFLVSVGAMGSNWYHGVIDENRSNTALIMSKMDTVVRRQEIINLQNANTFTGIADRLEIVEKLKGIR